MKRDKILKNDVLIIDDYCYCDVIIIIMLFFIMDRYILQAGISIRFIWFKQQV